MQATHLVVLAGGERFAIRLETVREVLAPERLTPVPGVQESVLGLINIRGEAVAVLDLRHLLVLSDSEEVGRFVVVTGDSHKAILGVEDVVGLEIVDEETIQESPASADRNVAAFVTGVAILQDKLTGVLDVNRLIEAKHEEIAGIAGIAGIAEAERA